MIGTRIQIGNIFKRKATKMAELSELSAKGRSASAVLNSRVFQICAEITTAYEKEQSELLRDGGKDDSRIRGRLDGAGHLRAELMARVELGKKAEQELQKYKGTKK